MSFKRMCHEDLSGCLCVTCMYTLNHSSQSVQKVPKEHLTPNQRRHLTDALSMVCRLIPLDQGSNQSSQQTNPQFLSKLILAAQSTVSENSCTSLSLALMSDSPLQKQIAHVLQRTPWSQHDRLWQDCLKRACGQTRAYGQKRAYGQRPKARLWSKSLQAGSVCPQVCEWWEGTPTECAQAILPEESA